jgi:hypothetical protein
VTEAAMLDKLTFRMPANIIKNLKEADLNKPADDGSANEAKRGKLIFLFLVKINVLTSFLTF